jgi:hypothetical protein
MVNAAAHTLVFPTAVIGAKSARFSVSRKNMFDMIVISI